MDGVNIERACNGNIFFYFILTSCFFLLSFVGTLLKDWFHYYGTSFDYVNEVITIQHDINQRVLKASIEESVSQVSVKSTIFRPSALCVQDPFELSHNLTQNVTVETLQSFVQSCREAHTILSNNSEQTVDGCVTKTSAFIELFTLPADTNQRSRKSFYSFTIPYVKSATIPYTPLQQTCKFIADLLNNELQIICEFQADKRADECMPTENVISNVESLTGENEIGDDSMCVDEDVSINEEFSLVSRKRPHDGESSNDLGVKRMKSNNESGNTTFTFLCKGTQITWENRRRQRRIHTANDDAVNNTEHCGHESAVTNEANSLGEEITQSREQNQQSFLQNVPDKSNTSTSRMEVSSPDINTDIGHTTFSVLPVIEFKLTISELTDKGSSPSAHQQCNVVLTHSGGSLQHFANFYAFFKKFVVHNVADECV